MSRRATLTEGPVATHLVKLTVPMIWGLLAMMGFQLADTWFVAQLGSLPLAAMSFTFPVVLVVTNLGIGLMAGTSSVIARRIGHGEEARVRRLSTDALILSTLLAVVLGIVGLVTLEPLFRLLGADDQVMPLVADYMVIWYLGLVFMLPPMAAVGAIRATGDSAGQSIVLISGSLANLVLDPLLIFGLAGLPRLELEGAALASVLARVITLAPGFYLLQTRHRLMDWRLPQWRELQTSCREVLHVAAPAAGTNVIVPLGMGVVTALVAGYGPAAVAGFGAASRIESLSLIVFYAMSSVIGPLVGQNLGAGRAHRVAQAIATSTRFCLGFGVILAGAMGLLAPWLAALFTDNPVVLSTTVDYLRWVPWSYGAAGIVMVINAALNGTGHPLSATGISVTRVVVLYVPLAYFGSTIAGVFGIFAGITAANLLAGAVGTAWWRRTLPRFHDQSGAVTPATGPSGERTL